jgi:hypothetical protein
MKPNITLYHGTFSEFSSFDSGKSTIGLMGKGIYLTSNQDDAGNYANAEMFNRVTGRQDEHDGVILEVQADIQNPIYISGKRDTVFNAHDGSLDRFCLAFVSAAQDHPDVPANGVQYMAHTRFKQEASRRPHGNLPVSEVIALVYAQIGLDKNYMMPAAEDAFKAKFALLQDVFKALKYDAVINESPAKQFAKAVRVGFKGLDRHTFHCAVFDASQLTITDCVPLAKERTSPKY